MIVPSFAFLGFATLGAMVFHLRAATAWRRTVLLSINLLFLTSFSTDPLALAPVAGFLAVGYGAYRGTRDGARPGWFVASLAAILLIFFWLKRYTFIPSETFLGFPYLVVGLSYIFFRVLHVVIDGHQGSIEDVIGPVSYLNYSLNFTSLVSGPIQRFQDYRRSEAAPLSLTWISSGRALERIVIGYFKVAIVSLGLSMVQQGAIAAIAEGGSWLSHCWDGLLIVACYPIYLYYNFSGYVDVVTGVAFFFGIALPENFDHPFSSENFLGFWSRWHMTLSNWLKTYVYNTLMMAAMERMPAVSIAPYFSVIAFFVTFFLVGLWHGQTSEFLFFGILQGGGVSLNKLYQIAMARWLTRKGYRAVCDNRLYRNLCRGLTFSWFAFTLLWFWSNWGQLVGFWQALGAGSWLLIGLVTILGSAITLALLESTCSMLAGLVWPVRSGAAEPVLRSRYLRTAFGTILVVVTLVAALIMDAPAPDIVYKAF